MKEMGDELKKIGDIVSRNGDDLHIVIEDDEAGWGIIELMCLHDPNGNYEVGERWTVPSDRPALKFKREEIVNVHINVKRGER